MITVMIMKKTKNLKNPGGNLPGGNFLGGSFPGGNSPGRSLIGELFRKPETTKF